MTTSRQLGNNYIMKKITLLVQSLMFSLVLCLVVKSCDTNFKSLLTCDIRNFHTKRKQISSGQMYSILPVQFPMHTCTSMIKPQRINLMQSNVCFYTYTVSRLCVYTNEVSSMPPINKKYRV